MRKVNYVLYGWICSTILLFGITLCVLGSVSSTQAAVLESPAYETVKGEIIDFKYGFEYGYREPSTWALIESNGGPSERVCVRLYAKDYYKLVVGDKVKVTYNPDNMQADPIVLIPEEKYK